MKKTKHWLHIILALLTGGLWLAVYVICLVLTREHNIGYRAGKRDLFSKIETNREYGGYQAYSIHKCLVNPGFNTEHHPHCNCPGCEDRRIAE